MSTSTPDPRDAGGSRPQTGLRTNPESPADGASRGRSRPLPENISPSRSRISGPHAQLRAEILVLGELLRQDAPESLLGESLSVVHAAVYGFLRDRHLGGAGAASSRGSAARGPTKSSGGSSRSNLTPAEKHRRRVERKFQQAKNQGLI